MVRGFSGGEFTTNCSSMPHQLRNVGTTLPKELTSACTIGFTTVGQRFTQIRFDEFNGNSYNIHHADESNKTASSDNIPKENSEEIQCVYSSIPI